MLCEFIAENHDHHVYIKKGNQFVCMYVDCPERNNQAKVPIRVLRVRVCRTRTLTCNSDIMFIFNSVKLSGHLTKPLFYYYLKLKSTGSKMPKPFVEHHAL